MPFDGFPKQALTFLSALDRNNNRDWFHAHKDEYERYVLEPARDFVAAIGPRLAKLSPGVRAEPRINGAIRRIQRDTRFSKDKRPYKDHQSLWFMHGEGSRGPGYYLWVGKRGLGLGAGMYGFDGVLLDRYRSAVGDERGGALAGIYARLEKAGYGVTTPELKQVPRGYDPDHPRRDLLRAKDVHAFVEAKPPDEFHGKEFVTYVMRRYRRLAPLVEWSLDLIAD